MPVVPKCVDANKNGVCDNVEKGEEGEEQVRTVRPFFRHLAIEIVVYT